MYMCRHSLMLRLCTIYMYMNKSDAQFTNNDIGESAWYKLVIHGHTLVVELHVTDTCTCTSTDNCISGIK
jgi:hypothetical protein